MSARRGTSWTEHNGRNTTTTSVYTGCESYGDCVQPVLCFVGNWNHTISSIAAGNVWNFFNSLK